MLSISKQEWEKLSKTRLDDADTLLRNGQFSGSYYLCGYAIELAIKAVIAKNFDHNTIPDKNYVNSIYTHKLADLAKLAGLAAVREDLEKRNQKFKSSWGIVSQWGEDSRYQIIDSSKAESMYQAVADKTDGVYQWITQHW